MASYPRRVTRRPEAGRGRAAALGAALCAALSGCAHLPADYTVKPSGATVWNFSNPADPLAASTGTARLTYRDTEGTGWGSKATRFAKASALRLPPVNGVDAAVMAFPAATRAQGYALAHNSPPNGVYAREGYVSNYTLVMDLLLPESGAGGYTSLYQCDADNAGDADMFVKTGPGGGLGVAGSYQGAVSTGAWHRFAWLVQCAVERGGTGQISKFIDGRFVGGQYTAEAPERCRWALGPAFSLFTDNDGETGRGYAAGIMFTDRLLTLQELTALGGASGRGADVPGPPPAARPPAAARRVKIIAHRTSTGEAPENTLAGIRQALAAGADIIEMDIRLSADGVPVLIHDEDVRRTTNGSGPVSGKTAAQLKRLDAGAWFDLRYAGERVPTLAEALREVDGRAVAFLDVKGAGMAFLIKKAMAQAGTAMDKVWLAETEIMNAVGEYAEHLPGAPVLWQGAPPKNFTREYFEGLKRQGITGFDIDTDLLTKDFVAAAHGAGMLVSAYTVLDPGLMLRLINMGVDAMETDYPGVLDSLMPPRAAVAAPVSPGQELR